MKKVFTDISHIAHLWANQLQDEARNSGNGNFYFYGKTIYSYGSHFPIATHVVNAKGEKAVMLTTRTYSVTTSKHIWTVEYACNHLNIIHCNLDNNRYDSYNEVINHNPVFNSWISKIEDIASSLPTSRKPEIYLNRIDEQMNQARKYAEFWGIEIPETLRVAGSISNKADYAGYAEKKEQARINAEKAEFDKNKKEHARLLKLWRNFEKQFASNTPLRLRDGYDYLRFDPLTDRIQTSQAVKIPLDTGRRFYQLVLAVIAKGSCINCPHKLLEYQVKEINKDFIQIGCHKITMKEITRLAKSLGWTNLSGI